MKSRSLLIFAAFQTLNCQALFAHDLHYYAVEKNVAPFQITTDGSEQKGFISDIIDELSSTLSLELETTVAPSPRVAKLLASKDHNNENWIAYDSPAWNSIKNAWFFSEPILSVEHSILHCGHDHIHKNNLHGHSLAVLKHFNYPGLSILEQQGDVKLVSVNDYEQGFKLVELGRVDGFVEMDIRLRYNFDNYEHQGKCKAIDSIGNAESTYDLYLVVNKQMDNGLKRRLDEKYKALKASGFVQKTLDKYIGAK